VHLLLWVINIEVLCTVTTIFLFNEVYISEVYSDLKYIVSKFYDSKFKAFLAGYLTRLMPCKLFLS
jgi:hypothetical protein